jgi:hypothetical protein
MRCAELGGHVSVEDTEVIDIVGINRETGHVILTISDHLDWSDSVAHQLILQRDLTPTWRLSKAAKFRDSIRMQRIGLWHSE